jgi:hypothetical protein
MKISYKAKNLFTALNSYRLPITNYQHANRLSENITEFKDFLLQRKLCRDYLPEAGKPGELGKW